MPGLLAGMVNHWRIRTKSRGIGRTDTPGGGSSSRAHSSGNDPGTRSANYSRSHRGRGATEIAQRYVHVWPTAGKERNTPTATDRAKIAYLAEGVIAESIHFVATPMEPNMVTAEFIDTVRRKLAARSYLSGDLAATTPSSQSFSHCKFSGNHIHLRRARFGVIDPKLKRKRRSWTRRASGTPPLWM